MTEITRKSGILPWQTENIQKAPSTSGVYVLRTGTDINSIVYVGSSDNLEARLREHLLSEDVPKVLFFDWYETENLTSARSIEKIWTGKYKPKYNLSVS